MPLHAIGLLAIILGRGHVLNDVRFIPVYQEELQQGHKPLSSEAGIMNDLITDKQKYLVLAIAHYGKNYFSHLGICTVKNARAPGFRSPGFVV